MFKLKRALRRVRGHGASRGMHSEPFPLLQLPPHIILLILKETTAPDMARMDMTCRFFSRVHYGEAIVYGPEGSEYLSMTEAAARYKLEETMPSLGLERRVHESWKRVLFASEISFRTVPRSISLGDGHVSVLGPRGEIFMVGSNSGGCLGTGDEERLVTPDDVNAGTGWDVMVVACGAVHTTLLTTHGTIYTVGDGRRGQLGLGQHKTTVTIPERISMAFKSFPVHVVAGGYHNMVLCRDGSLYSWGDNDYGQLGHGDRRTRHHPDNLVMVMTPAVAIAAGGSHSAFLTSDGSVYTFGRNNHGQLGLGNNETMLVPRKVETLSPERVVHVALGDSHSAFLSTRGMGTGVYMCGKGSFGQLGVLPNADMSVPFRLRNFVLGNEDGVPGSPELTRSRSLSNQNASLARDFVVQIALGRDHSGFVTDRGRLYTCGRGTEGQLGHRDSLNYSIPTFVKNLGEVPLDYISFCGNQSACVSRHRHVVLFGAHGYRPPRVVNGKLAAYQPPSEPIQLRSTKMKESVEVWEPPAVEETGERWKWVMKPELR